jgi:flavin reductase (DIM6/NTAB) family NADH-FMN oxidoreductase RutF
MQIDPAELTSSQVYSLMIRTITPRPIAWVSTLSAQGITNLAPFSYFAGVGSNPPSLVFSCVNRPDGSLKDTVRNLQAIPEFVVNVVPYPLAEKMQATSQEFDYEISEFQQVGLTEQPSVRVRPPRVAESPIRMECRVLERLSIGSGGGAANLIVGEIVWFDVQDRVLDQRGKIDPQLVDAIGRLGGKSYCRTLDRFDL